MRELEQHVARNLSRLGRFDPRSPAVVGVSGGVDSMVLLHVLRAVLPESPLIVAHLNHQLRGRAAERDEAFVRRVAASLNLECRTGRENVRALAREQKLSIEMAARKSRHQFLAKVAAEHRVSHIFLAHHADDQVELFFVRLLRGAGAEGLGGMKEAAPSPENPGLILLRPLLDVSKNEILEYARSRRIDFREDSTNRSAEFVRNRIRAELVPLLQKKYQPSLRATVLRTMKILRAQSDLIHDLASAWVKGKSRVSFVSLEPPIQQKIIQDQLYALGINVTYESVEWLVAHPGRWISLKSKRGPVSIRRTSLGRLEIRQSERVLADNKPRRIVLKGRAGKADFSGLGIRWRMVRSPKLPVGSLNMEVFDAQTVGNRILLRNWKAGDRFRPIGMPVAVKLQDLFVNGRIPADKRNQLVVACDERNAIFWVEGLRMSELHKLTPATTRSLQWSWQRV